MPIYRTQPLFCPSFLQANSSLRLDIADSREQVEHVQFKHSTMVAEWEAEIAVHSGELEALKDQVIVERKIPASVLSLALLSLALRSLP